MRIPFILSFISLLSSTLIILSLFSLGSVHATNLPTDKAILRWLDKVTGRVSVIEVEVGETVLVGNLAVAVEVCFTRPIEETPEDTAFLKIWDIEAGEDSLELFKGWMFSSSPALSALDHAVYDVWVLDCN